MASSHPSARLTSPRAEKQGSPNFVISKAVPLSHSVAKARHHQKVKTLKKSVDNLYVAENYYKGISDESLLYEKDGTISKMLQFDYKVHKLIKK